MIDKGQVVEGQDVVEVEDSTHEIVETVEVVEEM